MSVFFDTSAIVDIDRGVEGTIDLLELLTRRGEDLLISTVTVAEIMTGANLVDDVDNATANARRILGQFQWIDLDGGVADVTGRLLAHLIGKGAVIEFQDVVIGASHLQAGSGHLVTRNKDPFERLPDVAEDVVGPEELADALRT